MARANNRPPRKKGQKKGVHGRMPVKRTINLVPSDQSKINPLKAIPAVIAVILLAALFGKFLVWDRLMAVSQAQARVSTLQQNLQRAQELSKSFGDVEDAYAHYTIEGMTSIELGLVNRVRVLELVGNILPPDDFEGYPPEIQRLFRARPQLAGAMAVGYIINNWSVSGNILTIEVNSASLEKMNELARQLEQDDIVDTCSISTANKKGQLNIGDNVWARLIVYLRQPTEEGSQP